MILKDFIDLFLDGNDDKVYIDVFNGDDFDELHHEIRIISPELEPLYDREIIALSEGVHNLSVTLKRC